MDELLIGDKNYISSKRAAKLTGYAKDYVGQLCREGRVPARLVGRSWYVLESAIQDHRFGAGTDVQTEMTVQTPEKAAAPSLTWEAPRYEAASPEVLPPINRLADAELEAPAKDQEESLNLQDSWRAWFDRVGNPVTLRNDTAVAEAAAEEEIVPLAPIQGEVRLEEKSDTEEAEKEGVNVPIRTVYHLSPEDLLPHRFAAAEVELEDSSEEEPVREEGSAIRSHGLVRGLQVLGITLAIFAASFAVIGTGYFDKYVLSIKPVSVIAGVSLYNK